MCPAPTHAAKARTTVHLFATYTVHEEIVHVGFDRETQHTRARVQRQECSMLGP
jgi:hypothetical protein